MTLEVVAPVVEEIACIPALRHLGAVEIGETIEETFSLVSRLGRKFVVRKMCSHSPEVTVVPEPVGKDERTYRLQISPTAPGERIANIDAEIEIADSAIRTVAIAFRLTGIPRG